MSDNTNDNVVSVENVPVETEEEKAARLVLEAETARLATEAEVQRQIEEARQKAEDERLARAEAQKEYAYHCWHHIMTDARVRDEVREQLLMYEPEAFAYGQQKIEAELAKLQEEKKRAEEAGFSVPITAREAAPQETEASGIMPPTVAREALREPLHETPRRKGRH